MKLKFSSRLTALLLAALFVLTQLAPTSTALAQRRRRRAARPAPARQPSPNATQRPASPAARAETAAAPSTPARRAGGEKRFESLLAADAYGVIVEVRKVGQLSQNAELKTALAALRLSGEMPKEVGDLVGFVNQHAEALGEARYVMTMMPGTPGLPLSLSALEFPTVEAAAAFEPKYRALVNEQVKAYKDAARESFPAPQPGVRGAPRQPGARSAHQPPPMPEINLDFRRFGNIIVIGSERFTLKRLRGEGAPPLADSVNFQTMRGRFPSESVFVYVDTAAVTRGWRAQMEVIQKQAEEAQAAAAAAEQAEGPSTGETEPMVALVAPADPDMQTAIIINEKPKDAADEPEAGPGDPEDGADGGPTEDLTPEEAAAVAAEEAAARLEAAKPSEEQIAVAQFSSLLRGWERGTPRIPETFAVAFALEGGTLSARAAVANTPDGAVNLIPFLPNLFNGPPVSSESATVAPADTDVFFSTSLEWTRIFNGILATADERAAREQAVTADHPAMTEGNQATMSLGDDSKPLMSGPVVEAIERLFGFKFKEDLLPSLGNEIAFSVPLSYFTSSGRRSRAEAEEKESKEGKEEKKAEKKAEAGFVIIVALADAEKARKILPRVAMALGEAAPGAAQTEKREGLDIQNLGGFSYVIINNHLALAEDVRAVRHVVDSYARRQTLDATNKFRDATAWQPKQRVAQVFVADTAMKYAQEDARRAAKVSSDPLVAALASQLDMTPEPAAYAATNEGDVLVHELRVPVNFIKTYAANLMISIKEAPINNGEAMAHYALSAVVRAQERFKAEKQQQRYATLEELVKEDIIEKWVFERQQYKIELNVSGDKFEATAVPLDYGKTGRRSFFVDESGVIRAADHQGKPATVEDPPADGEQ